MFSKDHDSYDFCDSCKDRFRMEKKRKATTTSCSWPKARSWRLGYSAGSFQGPAPSPTSSVSWICLGYKGVSKRGRSSQEELAWNAKDYPPNRQKIWKHQKIPKVPFQFPLIPFFTHQSHQNKHSNEPKWHDFFNLIFFLCPIPVPFLFIWHLFPFFGHHIYRL